MNQDDIIRIAREAGIYTGGHPMNPLSVYTSDLKRFATLVAAAEREACAQECLGLARYAEARYYDDYADGASHSAALIRKRDDI